MSLLPDLEGTIPNLERSKAEVERERERGREDEDQGVEMGKYP